MSTGFDLSFADITAEEIEAAVNEMFPDSPMLRVERGIAFCEDPTCPQYLKAALIYKHEGLWTCPVCEGVGYVEPERGLVERVPGRFFGEVVIHYKYDTASREYKERLILRDEELGNEVGRYQIFHPTIKTSDRASKFAEQSLIYINSQLCADDHTLVVPPLLRERQLNLDKPLPEIKSWLESYLEELQSNPFYQEPESSSEVVSQRIEEPGKEGESSGSQPSSFDRTFDQDS